MGKQILCGNKITQPVLPAMTQSKASDESSVKQSAALVEEEESGKVKQKGLNVCICRYVHKSAWKADK